MGHRVIGYWLVDDSTFAGLVIICISRYVIIIVIMIFKDMGLVLGMFWACILVVSWGSLITLPTFVRGAVDDSMLRTLALEACVSGKRCWLSFRRSWGAVHNNWILLRSVGGWWSGSLGGQGGDFPLRIGVPLFLGREDIMQIGSGGFFKPIFSDSSGFAEDLIT